MNFLKLKQETLLINLSAIASIEKSGDMPSEIFVVMTNGKNYQLSGDDMRAVLDAVQLKPVTPNVQSNGEISVSRLR